MTDEPVVTDIADKDGQYPDARPDPLEELKLERALEVAIDGMTNLEADYSTEEYRDAAAKLRAALPWIKECETWCEGAEDWLACDIAMGKLYAAYRAMKEGE